MTMFEKMPEEGEGTIKTGKPGAPSFENKNDHVTCGNCRHSSNHPDGLNVSCGLLGISMAPAAYCCYGEV